MNPKVSVILPAFNAAATLHAAVESILRQTYTNIELICIDDGSKDSTLEVLNTFKDDSRVNIISRENRGLIASLNEGIDASTGKYIARMDADDISLEDRIEKQVNFLEAHSSVVALGGAIHEFDETGYIKVKTNPTHNEELQFHSLHKIPIWHPTAMFRADIVKTFGVRYDAQYPHAEDAKFWFELSKLGELANLEDVLLNYRRSDEQASKKHNKAQRASANKARLELYYELSRQYGLSFDSTSQSTRVHWPEDNKLSHLFVRFVVSKHCDRPLKVKVKTVINSPFSLRDRMQLLWKIARL
ncbi:glycosyltransferase family 2 protein [Vibrio sp. qd031]|uniref:glycosyltransferase family 2 protein n=1 Tax=Vibrio sp. qd031 TaxID=1603038 RepID=UPI0015557533|nr:glycosyltransferase family 2 protein [Vibrio sp. qd031]